MKVKRALPFWGAAFIFCTVSFWGQYFALLHGAWVFPSWLFGLIFLAAWEAILFNAYFAGRQTPLTWRLLVLLIFLTVLYFPSGGFKTASFAAGGLLIFLAWFSSGSLGRRLAFLEKQAVYLKDKASSAISWEYESLEFKEQGSRTVGFFWRQFFTSGLGAVVLAVTADRRNVSFTPQIKRRLLLLGWGALAAGLIFQSLAYLFRLNILWSYGEVSVRQGLNRSWVRNLAVFVAVVLLVISLLPVNFSPVGIDDILAALKGLLSRLESPPMPGPDFAEPPVPLPAEVIEQEPAVGGYPAVALLLLLVLTAGLAGLIVLLTIGFLLSLWIKGEAERLRGLPALLLRLYRFFVSAFKNLGRGLREAVEFLRPVKNGVEKKEASLPRLRRFFRRKKDYGSIRFLFREIVQVGRKKGLLFLPASTPAEYGEVLLRHLPDRREELAAFLWGYHLARYGAGKLTRRERARFLAAGSNIVEQLARLGEDEEIGFPKRD